MSASTQNQAFSALLFLYAQVVERPLGQMQVERAQRPRKLPVVLTKDEVKRLREQVEGVDWLMMTLLYGSGLRLLELLRLRVKDVDLGSLGCMHDDSSSVGNLFVVCRTDFVEKKGDG